MMVAVENGEPVAVGSHQPVDIDGTEVSEVVGVATLPRLRGRGLGAGITSALVAHATETADMVFLAAGDDDVARIYERVGFARLATAAVAERPDGRPGRPGQRPGGGGSAAAAARQRRPRVVVAHVSRHLAEQHHDAVAHERRPSAGAGCPRRSTSSPA